jgi:nucleoside-diphosphate-sugar epimerase
VKALVTGGGGFLGAALCRRLIDRGDRVRSFSRGDYPALREEGVETFRGDLADQEAVCAAAEGCGIVFHAGARAGIWGPSEDFIRTNIDGTANVLEACRRHGVGRLVFTSSPSVVFDGADMEGVDESVPYPARYEAAYPETKARAEQMVLAANGPDLATVALRPHLIWGPGDNHLVPRDAHLRAAERLAPGAAPAGRAYFITNAEPVPLWELVDRILDAAHLPPVERSVSPKFALAAGALLEFAYRLLRLTGEPRMTRFLARELSTAHWFDIGAARRDLGYEPAISLEEGLRLLEASFQGVIMPGIA